MRIQRTTISRTPFSRDAEALRSGPRGAKRRGFVLIVVLIVIAVLSLAAYRYSDMMIAEFRATDRILKNTEAQALADSGIHYTIALLSDQTAFTETLNGNPYDNSGAFKGKSLELDGVKGQFSILAVDYSSDTGSGQLSNRYGVTDEAGKININALIQLDPSGKVLYNALMSLQNLGMTSEIAYSIVDWVDADSDTSQGGAEDDYYTTISPAYHCKNGPLDSLEELLLVKGVTPALLFGTDLNRNGQADPEEASLGQFSYGWVPFLTVYSRELNVDNAGNPRIYINGSNLKTVYDQLKAAVGNPLAAYLVAYRIYSPVMGTPKGKTNAGTPADLVTVVETAIAAMPAPRAQRTVASIVQLIGTKLTVPGQNNEPDTVYSFPITNPDSASTLLPIALDKLTTSKAAELPARINVLTAPTAVLMSLPGVDQTDIGSIISARPALTSIDAPDPIFATPAWLYTKANITAPKLVALEKYVTSRAQVYRIQSIGYFDKSGPVTRIEAVVDTNNGSPRILYYRDLTELGRAFDPPTGN